MDVHREVMEWNVSSSAASLSVAVHGRCSGSVPLETAGGAGGARALMLQFARWRTDSPVACPAAQWNGWATGSGRTAAIGVKRAVRCAFAGGHSPVARAIGKSRGG